MTETASKSGPSSSSGDSSSTELWRKSALELGRLIAAREVSSREVVEAHLRRIDEVNGQLNAIVRRLDESALEAADATDHEIAHGRARSPLHGVPFTVKENIDLAGTPTTNGLQAMAEAVVPIDAPQIARMRAVGAIPMARTNLPDVGLRVHTHSSLHGLTRNPWNAERTAGGSSGGEASALASGMSPLGFGNDLGGSLRNPAHCCGISSLKPSTGVVPRATVIPPEDMPLMFQLMAVEGPMARHVADLRETLMTIAGADIRDPLALPVQLRDHSAGRRLRVAVLADPPGGSTDPGIAAAIRHAADVLADQGAEVTEESPPSYARALELWALLLMEDIRGQMPILEMVMGQGGKTFLGHTMTMFPPLDMTQMSPLFVERSTVEREWHRFLHDHDVLLTPTWTQPAFRHDADIESFGGAKATLELMRPVLPANLLGLPAAVVPVGVADGMPVGAQLTGRRFADLTCLAAAELLENALGVLTPIDPR
jgi:amidase